MLLDPKASYVLMGEGGHAADDNGLAGKDSPPPILHLKLSANVLEELMNAEEGAELSFKQGSDSLLSVGGQQHNLHTASESNPHELYSLALGSSTIKLVGSVAAKLSIRPDSHPSSSATSRLKERRELEEARKTEHRTVLLDSTPSTSRGKSTNASTSSSLKLRPKGLAPSSTNSPLIRSRAGTPNDAHSLPGSPNVGGVQRGVKTPPTMSSSLQHQHPAPRLSSMNRGTKAMTASPPTMQTRVIQLLAKGPISRKNILLQLQNSETNVLSILQQVGEVAPSHMQPATNMSRKFSGPVNRRTANVSPSAGSGGDSSGAGTLYILKDEHYSLVLIKEWPEYDANERQAVSEYMEAALKRLAWNSGGEEWKRLYPDGRPAVADDVRKVALGNLDDGGDLSTEDEGAKNLRKDHHDRAMRGPSVSSSAQSSPTKADLTEEFKGEKAALKKNSTMDRLKKAAKGKSASKPSTAASVSSVLAAKKKRPSEGGEEGRMANTPVIEEHAPKSTASSRRSAVHAKETLDAAAPTQSPKEGRPSKRVSAGKASATQKRAASVSKTTARKDIEYTDSSEDEEMLPEKHVPTSKGRPTSTRSGGTGAVKTAPTASTSPEGKRARHGVGGGAAFMSEPWLDVKSRNDWERLAERFKRVYDEYMKGVSRLREEEDLVRTDLEQAKEERAEATKSQPGALQGEASLQIDGDEKEEGEASPTLEQDGVFAANHEAMSLDPASSLHVTWRTRTVEKREDAAGKPLALEELQARIQKLQETEAQLSRMKGTLETSKKRLQLVAAA